MKKLLALVLALVMTLSLATVSTNAAFDDADNIEYTEAVEVMNAIGVLEGDGTGNFNPKGILNREQAAKILSIVLLGKSVANKLSVGEVSFADVNATDWAAPYIAYCAANGIVVGDGTNFYPKAELTGHAFAKMLLVAIGANGTYTGADWAINVAVDVQKYGLDNGLDIVLSDKLTREEAAQMALNAVLYSASGEGWTVTYENDTFEVSDTLELLLWKNLGATIKPASKKDTLLYKTFKVVKGNDVDNFGRPTTIYTDTYGTDSAADDDVIVEIVAEPDYTYAGVNYKETLYTKSSGELYYYGPNKYNYTQNISYNGGVDTKVEKDPYERVGTQVEIYVDDNNGELNIIVLEGYYTEVAKVSKKLSTGVTTVTLNVYEAGTILGGKEYETYTITSKSKAEYALVSDFAKGDIFVGFYQPGWAKLIGVDTDIETVEATVKTKKADTYYNGYVTTTDGDKLTFANEYSQKEVKVGSVGTFYLYNDYVIHFESEVATVSVDDVFYIVKAWSVEYKSQKDAYNDPIDDHTEYFVQVIYLDGTVDVLEVSEDASDEVGKLYTASYKSAYDWNVLNEWKSTAYGYYTDTIATGKTVDSSSVKGSEYTIRLNSATQNVVTNNKTGSGLKVTTSTGILNAKLENNALVIGKLSGSNLTASYVIVTGTESATVNGDVVYVFTEDLYAEDEIDNEKVYIVNVLKLDGTEDVLYVTDTTKLEAGWNAYVLTDGIAALTPVTDSFDEDKVTGALNGEIKKNSFYNELLTIDSVVDLDISGAVVVDLCDCEAESTEDIVDLVNAGWTLTIDLYAKKGAITIVVTNIAD